jgi:hypothetical protein
MYQFQKPQKCSGTKNGFYKLVHFFPHMVQVCFCIIWRKYTGRSMQHGADDKMFP